MLSRMTNVEQEATRGNAIWWVFGLGATALKVLKTWGEFRGVT
jgi:hypothetical protein